MVAVGQFEKLAQHKAAAAEEAALAGIVVKVPRKMAARKRAKGAPTHVRSVPLRLSPAQQSMANTRLTVGVRLYNAALGELINRSRLVRADPRFAAAKKLPTGSDKTKAFNVVNAAHGFTTFHALTLGSSYRKSYLGDHILAQEAQLLAKRAFSAVQRWNFGLGGKPRFKTSRDGLRSLACTDNHGSLHPKVTDGQVAGFLWGAKHLLAFAAPPAAGKGGRKGREQRADWAEVEQLILDKKVISSMIVKQVIRGKATFRANLTIDGAGPVRHPVGTGHVSLDMGPSTVAVVIADRNEAGVLIPTQAKLMPLAPQLADTGKLMRRLSRKFDRQHRAGSPGCFDTAGRHRSRGCRWINRSKNATRTQAAITELHRRQAEYRKTSHRQQINELLTSGSIIHTEKINYLGWQKNWPRSVRDRAPGLFVEQCRSKAGRAGGGAYEYSTFTTALSQTCVCAAKVKKKLSQRVHRCSCGVTAQRDVFSAFLGLYVQPVIHPDKPDVLIDTLDLVDANLAWIVAEELLRVPVAKANTPVSPKQRGRWAPSGRSMARIRKRHQSPTASDRAARPKTSPALLTASGSQPVGDSS